MASGGAWEHWGGFGPDAGARPEPEALLACLHEVPPYPPTAVGDLVARSQQRAQRRRRTRLVAGFAAASVVVLGAGLGVTTRLHRRHGTTGQADSTAFPIRTDNPAGVATAPQVDVASWRGHGELAFISSGQLNLLANDGTVVAVLGSGTASQPQWSADGAWVAYLRTPSPPATEPYDIEPSSLWVTSAAGTSTRPLSGADTDVTKFAWAASGDTLAFEAVSGSGPAHSSSIDIFLATPAGARPAPLVSAAYIGSFDWAPSGDSLAVDAVRGYPGGQYRPRDQLEIVPIDGSAPRVIYGDASSTALVASWWPDGRGLLFWIDPGGSGSATADGLSLESLDLASGAMRPLATTLPYRNWLAWSPDGTTLALVAGNDRVVWDSSRRVEWCRVPAGTCTAVGAVAGTMSLEPAWTPSGALLFVRAPAETTTQRTPWTSNSSEPFSSASVSTWLDRQTVWTVSLSGGPARLLAAGGAHSPVGAGEGEVFSRHDQLWWLDPATGATAHIAGPIGTAGIDGTSNYGYIDWAENLAWHR